MYPIVDGVLACLLAGHYLVNAYRDYHLSILNKEVQYLCGLTCYY